MAEPLPMLSLLETRVLGTLVEKQRTVPDTYPLSVNALVAGCNQKTSRNPVIEARESDVVQAIDVLKGLWLVNEISGSRVSRFEHRLEKILAIPTQASALLTVLMLRGPQTAGELRLNCERLHRFADISSVEAFLEELASREAGALVVELPRLPGSRENRWAHLLSGQPEIETAAPTKSPHPVGQEVEELKARVAALEAEMVDLRRRLGAIGA
ncbi:MAG: YceH family protein [Dechloromonas sp.]|nr:YceH family protein [Dechloromonas sp.]